MRLIASNSYDARTMCGTLCLQHKVNEYLWGLKQGGQPARAAGEPPMHVNFI
jgi:hypothetical protein